MRAIKPCRHKAAPAQPNIPGSAHLGWPKPRRRGPECRATPARTAAVVLAKRSGMMSQNCCSSVQFLVPTNHFLFGQKDSLFPEEQGIGYKLLNRFGFRLPNPPREAGIGRDFQKFP